jgi:hypothetical protein
MFSVGWSILVRHFSFVTKKQVHLNHQMMLEALCNEEGYLQLEVLQICNEHGAGV